MCNGSQIILFTTVHAKFALSNTLLHNTLPLFARFSENQSVVRFSSILSDTVSAERMLKRSPYRLAPFVCSKPSESLEEDLHVQESLLSNRALNSLLM